jgi:CubicO group peptidase (beta-lactamase class C family)
MFDCRRTLSQGRRELHITTQGFVAPGFQAVAEAFGANFADREEVGAAFAAYVDGELVVDLWGGAADRAAARRWEHGTVARVFSGTKGLVASCLLLLLERGELELDAPVARYWSRFAARGKGGILVRHVVSHTAGLPGIRGRLIAAQELLDDGGMAALLADEVPVWPPGTVLCYHPLTYGWLCGELVRRVDGRSVGAFFADEIAEPLGLRLWIGLPEDGELDVAALEFAPDWGRSPQTDPELIAADPVRHATWGNPPILVRGRFDWMAPEARRAELPGAGAIGEARSMARLYGCLACGGALDGVRVLAARSIEAGTRLLARGRDPIADAPAAYATGFALQDEAMTFGPPLDAFGHGGAGGSLHGAWPAQRVGFSYVPNQLRDHDADERSAVLLAALHRATTTSSR